MNPLKMIMAIHFFHLRPYILIALFFLCASCGRGPDWGRPATEQEIAVFERRQIPVYESAEQDRPPNVVLIMVDDMGIEAVGSYGSTSCTTPQIDRLAASGMRFLNAHATPLCTPSRVRLLTGRYSVRNYTRFAYMDPGEATFAQLLQQAGYVTGIAGKWQLGGTELSPYKAGFDEYCLWQLTYRGHWERFKNPRIVCNGAFKKYENGEYGPDLFLEFSEDFMTRHRNRPFLLYYPMVLTHIPFQPTPDREDYHSFDPLSELDDPVHFPANVAYADKIVGRVISRLRELGLSDRTLVIFTADNGTDSTVVSMMGEMEVPGGKGKTTEWGTHVPLIVSRQGSVPGGTTNPDLIDFADIFPTIMEAAGIQAPADLNIDGKSFYPQLLGKSGQPREWLYLNFQPKMGAPLWLVNLLSRSYGYRFVPATYAKDTKYKLYDDGRFFAIRQDPFEQRPISASDMTDEMGVARDKLLAVIEQMAREQSKKRLN